MAGLLMLSLWVTHSRSAEAAVIVSLAALWLFTRRSSKMALAIGAGAAAVVLTALVLWNSGSVAQSSAGASADVRVRMTKIGLQIAARDPLFGIGLGQFRRASQAFITPDFIVLFPQTAHGENAHDNFIQILAELGVVGFAGFIWLLGASARSIAGALAESEARPVLAGLAGGLLAFLVTCLSGHPFLITEVLWLFFLMLGVATGLAPVPSSGATGRWGHRIAIVLTVFVLISAPIRLWQLRQTADLDHVVIGASDVKDSIDGLTYRIAEQRSEWFVTAKAPAVEIPLRLTDESPGPCLVHIDVDGQSANVVPAVPGAWSRAVMQFDLTRKSAVSRRLDLRVDGAGCRLMVGTFKIRD